MRRRRSRYPRKRRMLRLGKSLRSKELTKTFEETNSNLVDKNFTRIHSIELFDIPRAGSLANTNNRRLHDSVIIKGIRLQKFFRNSSVVDPLVINLALVTSRSAAPGDSGWGDGGVNFNTGFFREYGANLREKAFNQVGGGLSAWEINGDPINPDRWIVHKRWTKVLEPSVAAVELGGDSRDQSKYEWVFNKYIAVNRVVHYQDTNDKAHDARTFVIYWFDTKQRDGSTALPDVAAAKHASRIITFFKEKNL